MELVRVILTVIGFVMLIAVTGIILDLLDKE